MVFNFTLNHMSHCQFLADFAVPTRSERAVPSLLIAVFVLLLSTSIDLYINIAYPSTLERHNRNYFLLKHNNYNGLYSV